MGLLGLYKCWKIKEKSPADQVWKAILRPIADLLEDQFEHLDAKYENPQIEALMIGKNIESSVPTIVFSCRTKICRQRALTVVRKSSTLNRYPGFRLADSAKLPSTIAKDESGGSCLTPGIHLNEPICGPAVSIVLVQDSGAGSARKATLGGCIRLDGTLYGLTVQHTLSFEGRGGEARRFRRR